MPTALTRSQPATERTAFAMLGVVVVAWGCTWPVSKLMLEYLSPIWTAAARLGLGAVVLLVIALWSRRLVWPVKGDIPVILSVALLHMSAFTMLTNIGMQYVPAGRSVVLAYTTPLWVIPAARLFLGERIDRARAIGLVMGIGGLVVIFNPVTFDWSDHDAVFGNALILFAALCWAANIVYIRSHTWITPPFELTVWQAITASILLIGLALAWDGVPHVAWDIELESLLAYSGIIGTALGFWAMVTVNRALPAAATSLGLLAVPVVGLSVSSLVLREPLDAALVCGTLLIVLGIGMGVSRRRA